MTSKKTHKTTIAILIIAAALAYLLYTAISSSAAYYISVDQFDPQQPSAHKHTYRLAGTVAQGSIEHDLKTMLLKFDLAGLNASLPIRYHGTVPENFTAQCPIVVEGRLDEHGIFQAKKLMTKCQSKYQAKITRDN